MFNGVLNKMKTEIDDNLNYFLELGDDFVNVNQLLGTKIKLSFSGYECLNCKSDLPLYRQGPCKKGFFE